MVRAEILPSAVSSAEEGRGTPPILLAGQAGINLITVVMLGCGWFLFIKYKGSVSVDKDGNLISDQQPNTKFSVKAPGGHKEMSSILADQ